MCDLRKGIYHSYSGVGIQKAVRKTPALLLFLWLHEAEIAGKGVDLMAWRNYRRNATGKYHNHKVERDGESFDSIKEYRRYCELQIMEKAGMIHGLERQKKFVLIPAQREPDTVGKRGGRIKGKVIERECAYIADFCYYTQDGEYVVEDVKSEATKTEQYKIKKKMLLYFHHIRIREV